MRDQTSIGIDLTAEVEAFYGNEGAAQGHTQNGPDKGIKPYIIT